LHGARARGRSATGATPEHERLGDGVARQAIGAVCSSNHLTGGEQARDTRLHLRIHSHTPHVIVRDRCDLNRRLREIDVVGGKPNDDRTEGRLQLVLRAMLEAQIGSAVRQPRPASPPS
jgi:hypothetical protein